MGVGCSASESLEAKEAQLNEILARANIDNKASQGIKSKVDDLLQHKNQEVLDLQAEVERVRAAKRQLNTAVENKLAEFGIPMAELGFVPKDVPVDGQ